MMACNGVTINRQAFAAVRANWCHAVPILKSDIFGADVKAREDVPPVSGSGRVISVRETG